MELSALIPSRGRPGKLAACVSRLARQSVDPGAYEVVVGLDGPDPASESAAERAWSDARGRPGGLRVVACARRGHIPVQHELIPTLRGEVYLSLNDDVLPCQDLLEVHLREQHACAADRPALVLGYSPFVPTTEPTLFDAMADRTPMLFFYASMSDRDPRHDWGYRHAFGLNCSMPMELVRLAGGVPNVPFTYGHEDIELAWRMSRMHGTPVLYRPHARADHDHRYRPADVLRREHALGIASWRYHRINPSFALDLFGRDIAAADELDYARAFLDHERSAAEHIEREFLALDTVPLDSIAPEQIPRLAHVAYQHFLLLKRYIWRQGLLDEAEGTRAGYAPLNDLDGAAAAA